MKLNLLSLLSFLAITITVSGQSLRGDQQNRDIAVEQQNAEPIATLDLGDNAAHLEYFDDGDGIIMMGTGTKNSTEGQEMLYRLSTILKELSPVEIFRQLSGNDAPADLVNAQNRIEKLMGTPSSMKTSPTPADDAAIPEHIRLNHVYDICRRYYSKAGDDYYARDTDKMYGLVEPYHGCVGIKTEKKNGSRWIETTGKIYRACAGGYAWADWWGPYMTYSIDIVEAAGDYYDMQVCWDE
jgi:hypothetical protein